MTKAQHLRHHHENEHRSIIPMLHHRVNRTLIPYRWSSAFLPLAKKQRIICLFTNALLCPLSPCTWCKAMRLLNTTRYHSPPRPLLSSIWPICKAIIALLRISTWLPASATTPIPHKHSMPTIDWSYHSPCAYAQKKQDVYACKRKSNVHPFRHYFPIPKVPLNTDHNRWLLWMRMV